MYIVQRAQRAQYTAGILAAIGTATVAAVLATSSLTDTESFLELRINYCIRSYTALVILDRPLG